MSVSLGRVTTLAGMLLQLKAPARLHRSAENKPSTPSLPLCPQVSGVVMIGVGFSPIDGNTPVAEVTVSQHH